MSDFLESLDFADQTQSGRADRNSFLVVSVQANTTNRYVEASIFINGQSIGRVTAADNHLAGVISSPAQLTTIPVPQGDTWEVRSNVATTNKEVRVWFIRT